MYRVNSTNDTSVVKVFPEGDEYFKGKLFITCYNLIEEVFKQKLKKNYFWLKKIHVINFIMFRANFFKVAWDI